jgi:hypothetical protein
LLFLVGAAVGLLGLIPRTAASINGDWLRIRGGVLDGVGRRRGTAWTHDESCLMKEDDGFFFVKLCVYVVEGKSQSVSSRFTGYHEERAVSERPVALALKRVQFLVTGYAFATPEILASIYFYIGAEVRNETTSN